MTHEDFLALVAKADEAAKNYYHTDSVLISDEEYDFLVEEIEAASQEHGWTEGRHLLDSVAAGQSVSGTVTHEVPMLSLGKVKTIENVTAFSNLHPNEKVVFEPKLDGLAISAKYSNGKLIQVATRGDGVNGEDLTANVKKMKVNGLPLTVEDKSSFEARGEIFLMVSDFEFANRERASRTEKAKKTGRKQDELAPFANPRNAVAGSLRTSQDMSYLTLTFGVYDMLGTSEDSYFAQMKHLHQLGFIPSMSLLPEIVKKANSVTEKIEAFGAVRSTFNVPTDGAVIKYNSMALRSKMGAASRHPRWAVAYKYEAELAQTKLINIVREVGRTGAISYVGLVEPVSIEGSTVARVTLNNSSYIASKDIRIGDTVFIRKANGIIPEIASVNTLLREKDSESYAAPLTCPKCGEPLDTTSSIVWRCTNPEDAIGPLLTYAVSRDILDVDGLSSSIINSLLSGGYISDLADLFSLTQNQLAEVEMRDERGGILPPKMDGTLSRIGTTVATKLSQNLEAAKKQPLNRILSAFGVRMMGRTFGRRLASHFGDIDSILSASVEDFLNVEGVGQDRAEAFYNGFRRNATLVEKLKVAGFVALTPKEDESVNSNTKAPLAGLSVVVTGSIPGYNRTEASELIEKLGGRSSSSISKSTGLLIAGENAGSKVEKAKTLGVRIETPEWLLTLI